MADRISELPDSILNHILSDFPTKFAATTSILSKRWESVWLSTFKLDFDDETFKDFHSFTNFVSSTMSSRDTAIAPPIRSLTFKCTNKSSPYDLKILNQVLNVAIERGQLENVNLHMPYESVRYLFLKVTEVKLVPSIFSCRTLQVLKLNNVILRDITRDHNQFDLPLLKTIHWYNVIFESVEYLIKFLSSCPVLQELQGDFSRIMYSHSYSKEDNFDGLLPKLVKANIFDSKIPICLLSHAQNLRIETFGLDRYNELPMFHRLINIELILKIHPMLPQTSKLTWLLKLLEHCPILENLTIQDCVDEDDEHEAMFEKYCKNQQIIPPCLSSHLKTFCLQDYKGTKSELQFITYIIQNSKVLNTMTIKSTGFEDIEAKHQMLIKLFSSTKGSKICKLLFD